MAKLTGFLEYDRKEAPKRTIVERLRDFRAVEIGLSVDEVYEESARCMDCGIPFCNSYGCPVENIIPDFNDFVYRGQWRKALALLESKNNFPEITGRVCPAPCESACTLGINQPAVNIRGIELRIVEEGWRQGWIKPKPPQQETGKTVAVAGSGPAGMAAAQQLRRAGHDVTVYESDDKPGGYLRYGIPDFKLEKSVLDRRLKQLQDEGVKFINNSKAGKDIPGEKLHDRFDAVAVACGSRQPRDLNIEGRDAAGIQFAVPYLKQNNRVVVGEKIDDNELISAEGKDVVVIGGGDTGADCVGTTLRQGAKTVEQLEIFPKPPTERPPDTPWPEFPRTLRTSSSHEEGGNRRWCINTRQFLAENGKVTGLECEEIDWEQNEDNGNMEMKPVSEPFVIPAQLVLLAMGFVQPEHDGLLEQLGVDFDKRGNVQTKPESTATSVDGVFAAGDAQTGAKLVVDAIAGGRLMAEEIDQYLITE